METTQITPQNWLQKNLWAHCGKNIRSPIVHALTDAHLYVYKTPFTGKLVAQDEHFSLFKEGQKNFLCVSTDLLQSPIKLGSTVALTPPDYRDFSGLPSDGRDDPAVNGVQMRVLTLGGRSLTRFPVKWEYRSVTRSEHVTEKYLQIENPFLRDMITQLEEAQLSHRRNIPDVLVNAKARNLRFIDTAEYSVDRTLWPSIEVDLATSKFTGTLAIRYDQALDTYALDLTPDQGEPSQINDLYFDNLADTIARYVDDSSWKKVGVTIIK